VSVGDNARQHFFEPISNKEKVNTISNIAGAAAAPEII
jgi:hypothetical protein